MTSARETHIVDLVDPSGTSVGEATVDAAHTSPGLLHRAFSVFLRDPADGRVLLQQRAAVKTRFPLRWANACCGHPLPGEDVRVAAQRRLAEELGVTGVALTPVGVHTYRAEDPSTTDWNEFLVIRQELLLRFLEIVERAGSAFAFPTRTVRLAPAAGDSPLTLQPTGNT